MRAGDGARPSPADTLPTTRLAHACSRLQVAQTQCHSEPGYRHQQRRIALTSLYVTGTRPWHHPKWLGIWQG